VKHGENFVRVATNVKKDDGSRAMGTLLDPNGKVIVNLRKDESYYGEASILGKNYVTGYVPSMTPLTKLSASITSAI
jgi:hypothetical protein